MNACVDGWIDNWRMDDGSMSIQKMDEGMDDGRIAILMDGWMDG